MHGTKSKEGDAVRNSKILIATVFCSILVGCFGAKPNGKEIAPGVYDDEQGSVHIIADSTDTIRVMNEIMQKKAIWLQRSPSKRVVTMTIITGTNSNGEIAPVGLLIHYEKQIQESYEKIPAPPLNRLSGKYIQLAP